MDIDGTSVDDFITKIEKILDDINIPHSLSEIGIPTDCAVRIAGKAMQDSAAGTNPRSASITQMRTLVETAISKAR